VILQEHGDQLVVIRQTDHAVLAGFFARELGNEKFVKPEPMESFLLAATDHDNGWQEWELNPTIDPVTFQPYSFMSIPTTEHMALYQRGIERVTGADPYAGLLVSLHCMELYDKTRATMPGFSAKAVKTNESSQINEFLQKLRLQQLRLKVELRSDGWKKDAADEKWIRMNSKRLEALDRLSLYFCMSPMEPATIEAVPTDHRGGEADWEVQTDGNGSVTIEPYPFRREPLEISILARRVPKRRYADNADFQKTLSQASFFAMKFTLRARESRTRALAAGL
jgi:hypothetical protein